MGARRHRRITTGSSKQGLRNVKRLNAKRVLMTGAGGLLGSDLARAFAAEGADLVLTTRTPGKIERLAEELRAQGARAETIAADFTCNEDIDRLAARAWDAFGGIEVVVLSSQPANPRLGDLLSTPDEVLEEQQRSIVWGPLRLMRSLAPKMMTAGGGSVITLTSSTGSEPTPGYAAYGLAKGSLWLLTLYMAKEWGQGGIRVNALQPGLIATGGQAMALEQGARQLGVLGRTSLDRVGANRECIGAAIYLASDESSFTSAQRICVDGGRI
jgi:NAD(P)-dependent dehydrogenase (short-subunit alcohol dehydrogenase family)